MSGPLKSARHERFACLIVEGKSGREAARGAGYTGQDASLDVQASRLLSSDKVAARVSELRERAARRTEITVASVTESLLRLAAQGESLGDAAGLNVARSSLMDAAKLNGLVIERTDATVRKTVSPEPLMQEADWSEKFADMAKGTGPDTLN